MDNDTMHDAMHLCGLINQIKSHPQGKRANKRVRTVLMAQLTTYIKGYKDGLDTKKHLSKRLSNKSENTS